MTGRGITLVMEKPGPQQQRLSFTALCPDAKLSVCYTNKAVCLSYQCIRPRAPPPGRPHYSGLKRNEDGAFKGNHLENTGKNLNPQSSKQHH